MASNRPIANELEKFVIKGRQGSVLVQNTILKLDQWSKESKLSNTHIEGATNFRYWICYLFELTYHFLRKIPGWPLYGVAQPTIQGIKNVLRALTSDDVFSSADSKKACTTVYWINLREEPICYINGFYPFN